MILVLDSILTDEEYHITLYIYIYIYMCIYTTIYIHICRYVLFICTFGPKT